MRKILLTFFMIAFYLRTISAQIPAPSGNDQNWQLIPDLSEEFNGPLSAKWTNDLWYIDNEHPDESKNYYCTLDNLQISGGVGNFYLKRENKNIKWLADNPDGGDDLNKFKTFPYTYANISTGRTHGARYTYGYYECRVKLPFYSQNSCLGVQNYAWWLYERAKMYKAKVYDVDWSEIDFFEIVTDKFNGSANAKHFSANSHIIKPFDYDGQKYLPWYKWFASYYLKYHQPNCITQMGGKIVNGKVTGLPKGYSDHAFTWHSNIDPQKEYMCDGYTVNNVPGTAPSYKHLYENTNIDDQWHTYGCEWLPDQLKIYIDGTLFFRLEGDFKYEYVDVDGVTKTVNPIHELMLPMPMILGYNPPYGNNPDSCTVFQNLNMQVDYMRYYQLKKDCNTSLSYPSYNFCTAPYQEKVYNSVTFGQSGNVGASALIDGCRTSIRATNIRFEDGFKVTTEGELYAHDVDCSKLLK